MEQFQAIFNFTKIAETLHSERWGFFVDRPAGWWFLALRRIPWD